LTVCGSKIRLDNDHETSNSEQHADFQRVPNIFVGAHAKKVRY